MFKTLPIRPPAGEGSGPPSGPQGPSQAASQFIRIDPNGKEAAEIPRAYFILPPDYTGDIWHLAAAQILWEYRRKDEIFPFLGFRPVTAILAWDDPKKLKTAEASFNYLRDIGINCVVVRTEKPGDRGRRQYSYDQLKSIVEWTSIEQLYDPSDPAHRGWNEFRNAFGGQAQSPITFLNKGTSADKKLLRYDISTSIVMQLMQYLGVKESVEILSQRLWAKYAPAGATSAAADEQEILLQAERRFADLEKAILEALKGFEQTHNVLLFNERQSDKNDKLNSAPEQLSQVRQEAEKYRLKIVSVLTGYGSAGLREQVKARSATEALFDIYNQGESQRQNTIQDKRVTVCFWTLVAQRLQLNPLLSVKTSGNPAQRYKPCIAGIIGGRSGSMDIASFVGVKATSWDLPFFESTFPQADMPGQAPQVARLINQRPITFLEYIDPTSAETATPGPIPPTSSTPGSRQGPSTSDEQSSPGTTPRQQSTSTQRTNPVPPSQARPTSEREGSLPVKRPRGEEFESEVAEKARANRKPSAPQQSQASSSTMQGSPAPQQSQAAPWTAENDSTMKADAAEYNQLRPHFLAQLAGTTWPMDDEDRNHPVVSGAPLNFRQDAIGKLSVSANRDGDGADIKISPVFFVKYSER